MPADKFAVGGWDDDDDNDGDSGGLVRRRRRHSRGAAEGRRMLKNQCAPPLSRQKAPQFRDDNTREFLTNNINNKFII